MSDENTKHGSLEERETASPDFKKCPFDLHVFVCTNTRPAGLTASCGPLGSERLRTDLKAWLKQELQRRRERQPELAVINARVNSSGCLDFCARGIAVAVYPDAPTFILDVKPGHLDDIKAHLSRRLDEIAQAIRTKGT